MTATTDTQKTPAWLEQMLQNGFEPYIATSRHLLPYLNTTPYGLKPHIYLMDEPDSGSFLEAYFMLEAYLLSNSLGFESPNLKMPHWVLIDCVLMQTAVVGFTAPKESVPEDLLAYYREDPRIDLTRLKRIPISGQISSPNIGARSLTGISLFSLGRRIGNQEKIGLYTRSVAMEVYRAQEYDHYCGAAQYDNLALRIHGQFTKEMEIYQPMVPLHPGKDMTFIYRMKIDNDPLQPGGKLKPAQPSFWLNANDKDKKREMEQGIRQGKRYIIAPPFCERRDNGIFLPIIEKQA